MESVMNLKTILVIMVVACAWLGAPASAGLVIRTTSGSSSCLQNIATGCSASDTTAELDKCCTAVTDAVDNHRQCFCLLQPALAEQGANMDNIAALFTYCKIDGDFTSLCPTTTTGSSTTPSGSSPVDNNPSTSSTSDSSSTTSGTGGGFEFGAFGGKNSGNKVAMMSYSSLLVVFASLMIIVRGI